MNVAPNPAGTLAFAEHSDRKHLARLAKRGEAVRLDTGVYVVGATLPLEAVTSHHLLAVVAHFWPEAVLMGRSAFSGGKPVDGVVYISHHALNRPVTRRLAGGVSVIASPGPAALPGDMPMPSGLHLSGVARGLVENIHGRGRPPRFRAGTGAVEDRIDDLARQGGAGRVRTALEQLDVIAGSFDPAAVEAVRQRLAGVLGTVGADARSERLKARFAGAPFDQHRLDMLATLLRALASRAPVTTPVAGPDDRWAWLPFYEAYFSNFIEGTEFGVDEARRIAVGGDIPDDRPADAHDVAATFRLVADPVGRSRTPSTGDEFVEHLKDRHRALMAAREDMQPGVFKDIPNYAGGYQFVDPDLVEGTLTRGFDLLDPVHEPFARAMAMMVLITECHPFYDGNGRVARMFANAELTAANEVRIIVPTSYRSDYLAGLNSVSNGGNGQSLVAILHFAQRWTAAIDWSTYEGALTNIESTHGFLDPGVADRTGQRLRLPNETRISPDPRPPASHPSSTVPHPQDRAPR